MSDALCILGASGLIGSACKRLFSRDPSYSLLCPTRKELDLLKKDDVISYFATHQPKFVILAAGFVGGIQHNLSFPADLLTKNLSIQLHVFEAAQKFEIKRMVFYASSCMYPKTSPQPLQESSLFKGEVELTSMSYAMAKLAGVQMARAFNAQYGEGRFLALIPNTVYGPHAHFDPNVGHVVSALMARLHEAKEEGKPRVTLWGDGTPRREFIHCDDVASATSFLLKHPTVEAVPINIGVGYDVSIKELALLLQRIVGYEGALDWDASKPNGAPRKLLDSHLIEQLGWKHGVDLPQGLAATYDWYANTMRQQWILQ